MKPEAPQRQLPADTHSHSPVARQEWIPQPGVLCRPEPRVRALVSFGGRERRTGVGARSLRSLSQLSHSPCEAGQALPSRALHVPICALGTSMLFSSGSYNSSNQSPRLCRGSPDPAHSPFGLDVLKARTGVKGRSLGDGQSCSQILALPCT